MDALVAHANAQGHRCDVWIKSSRRPDGGRVCGQPYARAYVGDGWANEGLTCAAGHFTRRQALPVEQHAAVLRFLGRPVPARVDRERRRDGTER